jgi:Ni,Fe-hydrogenase III large subunit
MEQAVAALEPGSVVVPVRLQAGAALGWAEAPRGAAFHWLRLREDGRVARYRINPPSFINWHGFHLSVENFAFQDLPIILATLDLSVAENDR